jgi:pimeloyl-ACP methyl ester carboxylesterase
MTTRPKIHSRRSAPADDTNLLHPTVIASHGAGSDASVWSLIASIVSTTRPMISWDQPGHGNSEQVAAEIYGPSLAYQSLCQVVSDESAVASTVTLLGHSLGGYLSCRYAISNPDRVSALVLIATGPGFRSPEAMEKWNSDLRRTAEKRSHPATLVGLHEDSFVMDHLADIVCPTLLIVGSDDAAFVGATDYMQRKIADAERVTVDGAGHMVPATHALMLGALINDFLTQRNL